MAILIKPIQKVNPKDPEAAPKWYITQVTTNQADETEVAMDIADETTLNPSEAKMALRQLRKVLLRLFRRLGQFLHLHQLDRRGQQRGGDGSQHQVGQSALPAGR